MAECDHRAAEGGDGLLRSARRRAEECAAGGADQRGVRAKEEIREELDGEPCGEVRVVPVEARFERVV